MPGGPIRLVCLSFQARGSETKEHIRRLLISCAHEMIQAAYDNSAFESFLYSPPFGVEQVEILLFLVDKGWWRLYDPDIRTAHILGGKLQYCIYDVMGRSTDIEETYEEAWQIIQDEDSALDGSEGCSCCRSDTHDWRSSVCASPEPIRKSRRGSKRWGQHRF